MPYQTLTLEKKEGMGIVRLSDLNSRAELFRLSDDLTELCAEVAGEDAIRVILLTGTGKKPFSIDTTLVGEREFCSITQSIARVDQPIIAAIHGDAIGQGLELAMACDIRIAAEGSHFGLPHVQSGLIPWDGGTQRLPRLVGRGKAMEMILVGEVIDAQEAYRIGLVHKVVPSDQLMTTVMVMAQEMATKGPIALRYTKEAVVKGMDMTLEQGLRLEADLYLLLHTTKDREEGIRAFREKRVPGFEGK